MKRAIVLILAAVMLTAALAACGEEKTEQKATEAATEAATSAATSTAAEAATEASATEAAVVETTAAGGTIEKTDDHYTVEKDRNGQIVSVADPSGNSVPVQEYIESRSGGSGSNSGSGSGGNTGNGQGSSSQPSSSSTPQKSNDPVTSSAQEVEESIPQIIIDIPEDLDEYELPIIG